MKTRYVLISVIVGLLLWLFWGHASVPEIAKIFTDTAIERHSTGNRIKKPKSQEPKFADLTQFKKWQSETRQSYVEAIGLKELNAQTEVVQLRNLTTRNGVVRDYMVLDSKDGLGIPLVAQYPVGATDLPAIIVIPGHTAPGVSGLEQLLDDDASYHHAAATQLAEAGFFTIALELRGFGLLGAPHHPEHKILAYNQLLAGSTYKTLILQDLTEILHYLKALKIIDKSRIGVAGASLGGELSVALAVVVPEIKAIAFSSYVEQGTFSGFDSNRSKQPHYCHLIPNLHKFMLKEDVFRLLAPRPSLGIRDAQAQAKYANFESEISKAWKLYGQSAQFEFRQIEGGAHEFYIDETIAFFKANL